MSIFETPGTIKKNVLKHFEGDWRAWLDDQDIFFPTSEWPNTYVELFLNPEKKYNQRFTFFLFLAGNGLEPELSGKLVMVTGDYDREARRHVKNLISSSRNPNWMSRYSYPDGHDVEHRWRITGPHTRGVGQKILDGGHKVEDLIVVKDDDSSDDETVIQEEVVDLTKQE